MPSSAHPVLVLLSFPTRRSSDLRRHAVRHLAGAGRRGGRVARAGRRLGRAGADADGDHRRPRGDAGHRDRRCLRDDAVTRGAGQVRSEEHTSELQSRPHLVCRLLPIPSSSYSLSLHDALPIFVVMQFAISLALVGVAVGLRVPGGGWAGPVLMLMAITAVLGATQDIGTDGVYVTTLSPGEQAK